ncbi:hypothetical protein [Streptococcus equi]
MSNQHIEELNDQQIVRREKMAALAEQGIDPLANASTEQLILVN